MTTPHRMVVWLQEAMDAAWRDAEATAKETEPEWSDGGLYGEGVHTLPHGSPVAVGAWGYMDDAVRAHIARHDPAAVLRRITADRQLLDLHANDGYGECKTCAVPDGTVEVNGIQYEMLALTPAPCATVRLLAEGYGWTEGG